RIGSDKAAETDIDACAAERHVRARERDRAGAESRAAVRTDQATGHHAGDSPAIDLTAREDIADGAGIASASVPTHCEATPGFALTLALASSRLLTTPALPMLANSPMFCVVKS